MPMTEQKFHIISLDPRITLCGARGRFWGDTRWPDDGDMRAGLLVRCKVCDRLFTPALEAAMKKARDLKHDALNAYHAGWRNGCGLPAEPNEPDWTGAEEIVRKCHDLGRQTGAEATRLLNEAVSAGGNPQSSRLEPRGEAGAMTAAKAHEAPS